MHFLLPLTLGLLPLINGAPSPAPATTGPVKAHLSLDGIGPVFVDGSLKLCVQNSSGRNLDGLALVNAHGKAFNIVCDLNQPYSWANQCHAVPAHQCQERACHAPAPAAADGRKGGNAQVCSAEGNKCLYPKYAAFDQYGCVQPWRIQNDGPVRSVAEILSTRGANVTFEGATRGSKGTTEHHAFNGVTFTAVN
ncbi:uncharacterized protein PFL1_01862 [Pseudozyma flocculosa PF-1]|uniref:Uncharacterized protein n=1 Tax=Pseudozyma flocculosa TaxID=84751 RepID=A0A5C3F001_9BASI|nr:uncharacterized protein PFL1_01862 [Pseudozyma flocculosa PF-1]EPQ30336.1 hypothetical protein PFL1_01862 [Pseudozyma flocculosa PF-1]SPO37405.1 uncharacterized protein PSFLO_02878 [Pseudozyma flocculosa]